jgi:eukaryotic-like serine/threonine-protein kinase
MKDKCPACNQLLSDAAPKNYCPKCGYSNKKNPLASQQTSPSEPENYLFKIDRYYVIKRIGRGGMGEVFLVYDPLCRRNIALKRVREDIKHHEIIYNRFLREAEITSQLAHPTITPIYTLNTTGKHFYYTMPFFKGETLQEILLKTYKQELNAEEPSGLGSSITSLVRIFVTICQGIAYAHSKDFIHRDLKAENIIIGNFAEVLILDWGIAKILNKPDDEKIDIPENATSELTMPGKIVGTANYISPECAFGSPANISSEIYSLGVILYQMLTLRFPFQRKNLEEFRKNIKNEKLISPHELTPYRDVPESLTRIVTCCLEPLPPNRYQTVEHLLKDLETYLEGRSDWIQSAKLNIETPTDWEFHENVSIIRHVAISRGAPSVKWVSLMVSNLAFPGNSKLETRVRLGKECTGLGFMINVPETQGRKYPTDGYCLWLSSTSKSKLFRSRVTIQSIPEMSLEPDLWYNLRFEKIDNDIYIYLNDILQCSYICHLPMSGAHIGVLYENTDFEMSDIVVFEGNINITLGCLAIPDAFLSSHNYDKALSEYRRIYKSFPWRNEGREAIFRAGITLLEQGQEKNDEQYFQQALEEFDQLRNTISAPLKYLGESLVYQTMQEYEEEINCLEFAFRKYPKHSLLSVLEEQVIYRLQESSQNSRTATYRFMLLILRVLPRALKRPETKKLFRLVQTHWEPLTFFIDKNDNDYLAVKLAFWLAQPYSLEEILDKILQKENPSHDLITNIIFCWIELGAHTLAKAKIEELCSAISDPVLHNALSQLNNLILYHQNPSKAYIDNISEQHILNHTMNHALDINQISWVKENMEEQKIWATLLDKDTETANKFFQQHTLEEINQENSILHFLYGCWLLLTEGKKISDIHLKGVLNVPYPRSWTLFTHYLTQNIPDKKAWFKRLFSVEKRELCRQAILYYSCSDNTEQVEHYKKLLQQEYHNVDVW